MSINYSSGWANYPSAAELERQRRREEKERQKRDIEDTDGDINWAYSQMRIIEAWKDRAMETKKYPTEVLASLSSGVLLCEFGAMHECAEFLMGHPIWTHHFADKALWEAMQKAILAQCPGLPTHLEGITKDNYVARRDELIAELGLYQTIRRGDGSTAKAPTDGIPDNVKTIMVEVPRP